MLRALAEVGAPPTSAAPPLQPGERLIPGYVVVAHLNRSNVLDVYDVWSDERACRCVAKVLRPDRADNPTDLRRLLREGRLLERFTHPHLVRAYETVEQPVPAIILETLTGTTLSCLIAEQPRLSVPDLALLGLHLSSAMHYLHRQGYLHLDLKPSNIVVDGGLTRVIDLSIARPPGPGRQGVGTRQYMSPEQARGDQLGPAADVWGIGAVLYEAATARKPFRSYKAPGRFQQTERRARPVGADRRLDPAISGAIDACLEPDPAQRPSIQDLLGITARLV